MTMLDDYISATADRERRHLQAIREHVHPLDIGLWCRLLAVAQEAARLHRLDLREMWPDSLGDRAGYETKHSCTGVCEYRAGRIRIVLRFKHPRTGAWMGPRPEADVWGTLAHELAHLSGCLRHDKRFDARMSSMRGTVDELRTARAQPRRLPASGTPIALGPANE